MKAYTVSDRNGNAGTTLVVFAETRGKALAYAALDDELCDYGFTGLRANRCPSLDKYYRGVQKMDWLDDNDRVAMVKDANFSCGPEFGCMDGDNCSAYQWCEYGQEYMADMRGEQE